jgi:facilitated trehalose transporter
MLFFCSLQDMGSDIDPYVASIALGTTRLLMSLLNAWILKRFKRRHLMMASGLGMATCMFISGLFTKWIQEKSTTYLFVPVVFMLLYVCASMIGLLTIPWIMSAEVFPTEIRGLAHSLTYCFANVIMFAAIKSYRSIQELLGGSFAIQWFFAVISLCGFFFGLFVMPETHGKKLSEIEAYFRGDHKQTKKSMDQRAETELMMKT